MLFLLGYKIYNLNIQHRVHIKVFVDEVFTLKLIRPIILHCNNHKYNTREIDIKTTEIVSLNFKFK